ncbi:protein PERCC1 [Hyperolius riggenbachi]|uniref:protein PERCC1 n=1 Tax=Hyperolius riggenbachi TaxID=752182 RepID=UPI0035A3872C
MATGVIRNLTEFKLPPSFQSSYLFQGLDQDVDFQYSSEEEEDEILEDEEMEDSSEELSGIRSSSTSDNPPGLGPEESNAEMTTQLLKFSEIISSDIQRYFGQKTKEEDPDSCNIYEDYFSPRGSGGQEMYYQDLVKIAQCRDRDREDFFNPLTPPIELDEKILKTICTKEDPKKLGPLTELFDFGLRRYFKQKTSLAKDGRFQRLDRKYSHIVPMHRRLLPMSFWKEPSPDPSCILNTNTPDFSDLLENWTTDAQNDLHSSTRDLMGEFSR